MPLLPMSLKATPAPNRAGRRGGGVALVVRKEIPVVPIPPFPVTNRNMKFYGFSCPGSSLLSYVVYCIILRNLFMTQLSFLNTYFQLLIVLCRHRQTQQ